MLKRVIEEDICKYKTKVDLPVITTNADMSMGIKNDGKIPDFAKGELGKSHPGDHIKQVS